MPLGYRVKSLLTRLTSTIKPSVTSRGEYSPSLVLALKMASVLGASVEEIFWLDEEEA